MARRTLFALMAILTMLTLAGVSFAHPHDGSLAVRMINDLADEPAGDTGGGAPSTTSTTAAPATTSTTAAPAPTTSTTAAPAPSTTSTTAVPVTTTSTTAPPSTTTTEKPAATTTSTTEKPKPTTTTTSEKPKVVSTGTIRLTCKRVDDTHITCSWGDLPEGSRKVGVMRQGGGSEAKTVLMSSDPSLRTFTDGSVVAGETYWYRVAAGTDDRKLAESDILKVPPTGQEVSTDKPADDPKTAVKLTCAQTGELQVVCEWSAPPPGTTKVVLMKERPGTPSQTFLMTTDTTMRRAVDNTVEQGVSYVYRIMVGNESGVTGGSAPARITIGAPAPQEAH